MTNCYNEIEFVDFLVKNPNWFPSKEEIVNTINNTNKKIKYKDFHRFQVNFERSILVEKTHDARCCNLNVYYNHQISHDRCRGIRNKHDYFCDRCLNFFRNNLRHEILNNIK